MRGGKRELRLTGGDDPKFRALVRKLDQEYVDRFGETALQYRPYNTLEKIEAACLLIVDGTPAACGAIQPLDEDTAELKRVYVLPEFRRRGLARQVVEQLKLADPDLVVFAGDTFDNEYAALEDPQALAEMLREIPSRYGVYSCWGNHDVTERLLAGFSLGGEISSQEDEKFREFFEQAGIQLLEDQAVLVEDSFYLVGRQDPQRQAKLGEGRLAPDQLLEGLDQDKPILVIDHQPGQLEELSQAGADLVLSGHTHNGQMFPGNLVVKLFWENPAGVIQVGNMTSCVTQGAGVWGPAMRVGTQNEIMLITVEFAGK